MVVRKREPTDRLAEARARLADEPQRLRVGDRRIEHDQVVAHLDDQAVGACRPGPGALGAISWSLRPWEPRVS